MRLNLLDEPKLHKTMLADGETKLIKQIGVSMKSEKTFLRMKQNEKIELKACRRSFG